MELHAGPYRPCLARIEEIEDQDELEDDYDFGPHPRYTARNTSILSGFVCDAGFLLCL